MSQRAFLDLSGNRLTGPIPLYAIGLSSCDECDGLDVLSRFCGVVVMKGFEIEYTRILMVFSIIDLSSNNFQGDIPKSIAKLNSLRGLNLSHNNLTGHIPTSLANLTNLESLDLSSNKLVGEIP
ncbi:hypothetical protein ACSBR1_029540 [Camellia fascicularis]